MYADFEYTQAIDAMQLDDPEAAADATKQPAATTDGVDAKKLQLFCVDLNCDADFFYLRLLKLKEEKGKDGKRLRGPEEREYVIRKVYNFWRSSINYSHTKAVEMSSWDACILSELSEYMKLYPQWLVF